jgi:hypothetical protein
MTSLPLASCHDAEEKEQLNSDVFTCSKASIATGIPFNQLTTKL